ncbi:response regulator [Paraburkholderia sp. JPY432]|uniref:response regulator n=1 Tax=Paraburkholderia youngii TaxID=2782701 RepID=UPI001595C767|nr:response regulator [Paraburkholderia youngii]NVH77242.1 response regulator [Paraburkholderia youngii]
MTEQPLIAAVDDDESVRESLHELLREFDFSVSAFVSAEAFLASGCVDDAQCLVLDIDMPAMSGFDLQQELRRRGENVPIVFISAHADEIVRSQVLEQGAVACLCKPFICAASVSAIAPALPIEFGRCVPVALFSTIECIGKGMCATVLAFLSLCKR